MATTSDEPGSADPRSSVATAIRRLTRDADGRWVSTDTRDIVAAEEPLEIRLQHADPALPFAQLPRELQHTIAITMRTPAAGDDFDLALGFLLSEGIIHHRDDVEDVAYCLDPDEPQWQNIVTVTVRPELPFDTPTLQRNFFTTSSCGICGRAALDALSLRGIASLADGLTVPLDILVTLPDRLRAAQPLFRTTGGNHAAGLFNASGALIDLREDVGRHNALDKLIGGQLRQGTLPLSDHILVLSGRASYELLQKALVAGITIIVAVGAPSSLAVDVANTYNLTLLGFTRRDSANCYAGAQRIS